MQPLVKDAEPYLLNLDKIMILDDESSYTSNSEAHFMYS